VTTITARFEVFTPVLLKIQVIWEEMLCWWAAVTKDHSAFISWVKQFKLFDLRHKDTIIIITNII